MPGWASPVGTQITGRTSEGSRVLGDTHMLEGEMHVRVLVVDDHPAFRRALTSALRLVGDIEIAGEAGGGVAACDQADALDPDVVLMDLSMPDLSGIDAMKKIHESRPDLPVVILTAHADAGRRAGGAGGGSARIPRQGHRTARPRDHPARGHGR